MQCFSLVTSNHLCILIFLSNCAVACGQLLSGTVFRQDLGDKSAPSGRTHSRTLLSIGGWARQQALGYDLYILYHFCRGLFSAATYRFKQLVPFGFIANSMTVDNEIIAWPHGENVLTPPTSEHVQEPCNHAGAASMVVMNS